MANMQVRDLGAGRQARSRAGGGRPAAQRREGLTAAETALHLHQRHHRPAQGRAHHPHARPALHARLRRRDRRQGGRPHLRHPAALPRHRRALRRGRGAAERRLGGDPQALLGQPLLERRRGRGLHDVRLHRRALPLSGQPARAPGGDAPQAAAGVRQRPAPRRLGDDGRPLRACRASWSSTARPKATSRCSTSTASWARSAAMPGLPEALLQHPRWCGSTSRPRRRCAGRTAAASRPAPDEAGECLGEIEHDARTPTSAMPTRRPARRRCCTTSSARATPGSAPAT